MICLLMFLGPLQKKGNVYGQSLLTDLWVERGQSEYVENHVFSLDFQNK